MIAARKLTKIFRTESMETTALCDIDLTVEEGEFLAVMGPSGCGKSTLLNVLGLLDGPTAGSYRFLDQEMAGLSERRRAAIRKSGIGFVFQNYNLIDELTIAENIGLPLVYQRVEAKQRKERVHQLLERFNLVPRQDHYPQLLSGGQQQRAAVARAVIGNPRLILADEPTGNLDSVHGNEVMEALVALNAGGATIVMVTHSAAYAAYAQRVVNLFDGSILTEQSGSPAHAR